MIKTSQFFGFLKDQKAWIRFGLVFFILLFSLTGPGGCVKKNSDGTTTGGCSKKDSGEVNKEGKSTVDSDKDGVVDDEDKDDDNDGIPDETDNCPNKVNPMQEDKDGNGAGDVCDQKTGGTTDPTGGEAPPPPDSDGDGVIDSEDNCIDVANADQANDHGSAQLGDACEDSDSDGWTDANDNCPEFSALSNDDTDGDGVGNSCDNCPDVSNADQADTDDNADFGDACQPPADQFVYYSKEIGGVSNIYRTSLTTLETRNMTNNTSSAMVEVDIDEDGDLDGLRTDFEYSYPLLSPNGEDLVYLAGAHYMHEGWIYTLPLTDPSGHGEDELENINHLTDIAGMSFSPDGQKLLIRAGGYNSDPEAHIFEYDSKPNLYILDINTGVLTKITTNTTTDSALFAYSTWSPTGDKIAYASAVSVGSPPQTMFKIFIQNINPTSGALVGPPVRLTTTSSDHELVPSFSPDGTKVLYTKWVTFPDRLSLKISGLPGDLMAYPPPGTYQADKNYAAGTWCPDGRILFLSNLHNTQSEIYVMNGDGSNLTRLTTNTEEEKYISCSPPGVFVDSIAP